jgi:hypothetical protein
MSEHSDDGFNDWLAGEELFAILRSVCERDGKGCKWDRNDDAMLECSTCGKVVDE